jgi:NADPH:quinone reductase-like Zn-dependent oxidoreductase
LAAGARVIITSSSQGKLDRVVTLLKALVPANAPDNVIQTINYGEIEAWDKEVRRLTDGKGVDFVIEIGGRATLARSVRSTKTGGLVAISGYLGDYASIPDHIIKEGGCSSGSVLESY